ncbi:MAG TPA: FKBP-type peptidyl-prolyl cis-trans isomerase [Microbacteriaceae bacterium]|nr:FKBP-type peptidyl-prolyl cis-trans isomerase [Microbacteriaceae bacterium]
MRKTPAILAATALVLTLAACAAPSGPAVDGGSALDAASCAPVWQRGGIAAGVTSTGDFGTTPVDPSFPVPLISHDRDSSAFIHVGDGAIVGPSDIVAGTITLVDGATGMLLDQTATTVYLPLAGASPLFDAAVCAPVGSRIAAVGTTESILGAGVVTQNGLDPQQTLVAIIDVQDAFISRAQGPSLPPLNGLPSVSLAANGQPGLSFTNATPPADLRIETLIQGSGTTVAEGDTVLLNYTGVNWNTRTVFDTSWERGAPAQFATTAVVDGFGQALVGQQVGSQVLVSIPPAYGYGDNPPTGSGIGATDTIVFVIDILGVLPAA